MVLPNPSLVSLGAELARFRAEMDQIESVFYSATGMTRVTEYAHVYSPAEDGCLVSMWDAWNRFVRNVCLLSSAGPIQGLSGTLYVPTVARTESAALSHLSSNRRGTRIRIIKGEPYWFDVVAIPDLTALLGLGNATQIVSAVTASSVMLGVTSIPNPLEEIRVCRNFIAHKGSGTLADIQGIVGPSFTDLCTHMRSKRYGVELFSDWKEGVLAIASSATQ